MIIGICMWIFTVTASLDTVSSFAGYDFSEIQSFLEQELPDMPITFSQMVTKLMSGEETNHISIGIDWIKQFLFTEIAANKNMIIKIIIIAVIGAIFTQFSSVFQNSQISETGFFITYLLMIGMLAAAFTATISIAAALLESVLGFMKVFLPTFFLAVAFVGGSITASVFYETAFGVISVMEELLKTIFIPMVGMYVTILFVNQISGEDLLSKTAELLKIVAEWGMKAVLGVVLGIQLIQGMILPFADAVKANTIQKAVKMIPGIGDSASKVSQIVVGGGVLVKNGIGMAALVVLVLLAVIPLLKLAVITLFYYMAAAIIQPIADERMSNCIMAVAEGGKLLIRIVFLASFLLFLMIVIVCQATNVVYLSS